MATGDRYNRPGSGTRRPGLPARGGGGASRGGSGGRPPLRRPAPRPAPRDDEDEITDLTGQAAEDEWDDTDGAWDESPRKGRGGDDGYSPRKIGKLRRPAGRNPRRRSSETSTSFILALLGWFVCAILSIIAFSMAMSEMSAARARREEPSGMTVAALWISGAHMALMALVIVLVVAIGFIHH